MRRESVSSVVEVLVAPPNRFTRVGSEWKWNFENLEPSTTDDLLVTIGGVESFGRHILNDDVAHWDYELVERGALAYRLDYRFSVTASSRPNVRRQGRAMLGYLFANSEETVTLSPARPFLVSHLGIRTGACRDFLSNGRATSVRITLDDAPPIEAAIPDEYSDRYWFVRLPSPTVAKEVRLAVSSSVMGTRSPSLLLAERANRQRTSRTRSTVSRRPWQSTELTLVRFASGPGR